MVLFLVLNLVVNAFGTPVPMHSFPTWPGWSTSEVNMLKIPQNMQVEGDLPCESSCIYEISGLCATEAFLTIYILNPIVTGVDFSGRHNLNVDSTTAQAGVVDGMDVDGLATEPHVLTGITPDGLSPMQKKELQMLPNEDRSQVIVGDDQTLQSFIRIRNLIASQIELVLQPGKYLGYSFAERLKSLRDAESQMNIGIDALRAKLEGVGKKAGNSLPSTSTKRQAPRDPNERILKQRLS